MKHSNLETIKYKSIQSPHIDNKIAHPIRKFCKLKYCKLKKFKELAGKMQHA